MNIQKLIEAITKQGFHPEVDDNKIDIDNYYFGASTKKEYNKALRDIDKNTVKGAGWIVYCWYDVSRYEYWMKEQREQNYIQVTVNVDEKFNDAETDALIYAICSVNSKAECIADTYNYDPAENQKRTAP